ncbi:MAG: hypothetical protein O3C67_06910, partial [Cyanobacteria bacterium]|nr:hypothetical protein [Cyanobacteriota bacterium]
MPLPPYRPPADPPSHRFNPHPYPPSAPPTPFRWRSLAWGCGLLMGGVALWHLWGSPPVPPQSQSESPASHPRPAAPTAEVEPAPGADGLDFSLAHTVVEGERVDTPTPETAPDTAATTAAVSAISGWQGGAFP